MQKKIIFSSLANNQTKFWINVSKNLNINTPSILVFDNESLQKNHNKYLIDLTFKKKIFNFKFIKGYLKKYNIQNLKKIFNHEIVNSEVQNYNLLLNKLIYYLIKLEETLENNNIVVFQELGGFVQNLSIFYFCKKNKIKHYFIEPSFYSGRFHCIEDGFTDFTAKTKFSNIDESDLNKLLSKILSEKKIVIPEKDKLHFQIPFKKFLTIRNFFRFINKMILKIGFKYEFVFYQNFHTLKIYFKEMVNFIKFKRYYSNYLPKNFIYFPLHVPNDFL